MREEDYKKVFETIEMKSDMRERIIYRCHNEQNRKTVNKGAAALIVAACCVILFTGANAITARAYGYSLVSKFYSYFQSDDKKVVDINMADRRDDSKDMMVGTPVDSIDKDLYSFLNENNLTDLVVPQNLTKDWKLTGSEYSKAGSSTSLKPSISFSMSNGTDDFIAFIAGGVADAASYQVGIGYVETKVLNQIEFLIIHKEPDLTYEKYLKELENQMLSVMKVSAEEFYETNTYKELGTDDAYKRFVKYETIIDFSVGGYDYSYSLSKGMDVDGFLDLLVHK